MLLLLILLISVCSGKYVIAEGVDFTCYNHHPRFDIKATDIDTYIGGFMSGSDTDADVTFTRAYETGTGSDLPSGSYEHDNDTLSAKLLMMPSSGGKQRMGAFACIFTKGGKTHSIITLIQDDNPNVWSDSLTIIANLGEDKTFQVDQKDSTITVSWWHNGILIDGAKGLNLPITNIDETDAGVYEAHQSGQRTSGVHALMRLIVRSCPANKWGSQCSEICRVCYNGGICNDLDGSCICAPGFSGSQCENVHGSNVFGQDGQLKCDVNAGIHDDGCQGKLLCMPDPFGCSCAAGYMGRDCQTPCTNGIFGADCKQTCHCNNGCLADTGECEPGDKCEDGWTGVNCQVCEISISSVTVTSPSSSSLSVSWIPSGITDSYQVDYQLLQKDQCSESGDRTTFDTTTGNNIVITGLSAFSTYAVFVIPFSSTCLASENSTSGTTKEKAPAVAPGNIQVSAETTTSLTFTWDEIPCGSRGGDISYRYTIDTSTHTTTSTSITVNNLAACSTYHFTVLAFNDAGDGTSGSSEGSTENEVPGAVTSLTVLPDSSRPDSLKASWDAPYPPCAERYRVEYQLMNLDQCDESDSNRKFYGTIASRSATIPELQPYSTYTIYVTAENDIGSGEETNQTERTAITAPNGPPSNVQNTSRTNTSLTFEWFEVACGYRGGPNKYMYELNDSTGKQISSGTTANLEVTIHGLIPCTTYNFKVKASNGEGDGVFSELINCATDIAELGPVRLLITDEISSDEWTASWSPQNEIPCPADEYFVEYALLEQDNCIKIEDPVMIEYGSVNITSATITGLNPYSMYEMYVYASNDLGRGERMSTINYTKESEPSGPPTTINALPDKHSIEYSWEEPSCGNRSGTILYYSYILTPGEHEGVSYVKNVTLDKLNPCSEYTLAISAATSVGNGPQDVITTTTEKEVPLQPSNLWLTNKALRELSVQWDEPDQIFCRIISYMITIRTVYKPYDEEFIPNPDPDEEQQTLSLFWTFEDLSPSTEYEIKAGANGEIGLGEFIVRNFSTYPADEEDLGEPLPRPKSEKSSDTTVTVQIPQLTGDESEFISEFKIHVESPNLFALANSPDPDKSYEAGSVLKTEVKDGPKDFIVGSGTEQNPPLEPGKKYRIFIGSCSVIQTDETCIWSPPLEIGYESFPWEAVYIPIILVAVIVVIALGIVYYKRRKTQSKGSSTDIIGLTKESVKLKAEQETRETESTNRQTEQNKPPPKASIRRREPPGPVEITNLKQYIKRKKSGEDYSFKDDYKMLPQGLLHPYDASKKENNRVKNRYANIATYDHTRVILSIQEDEEDSDYINASYINGYKTDKKYIASQGPNQASIKDFWRMIWENKLIKIVMVTNLIESGKVKCEKYWPEKREKPERYGNINVVLTEENIFADYTFRYFTVTDVTTEGRLQVCQFHFTAWPDMGLPDNASSFLNFVKIVRNHKVENTQPAVVHCSAGVGRTGTFIAVDSLIDHIKKDKKIDVFQFVSEMRECRMKMIQTADQYEFIFDAILEHVAFGDTSIPISAFRETFNKLKIRDAKKKSGLSTQFENLQDITVEPSPEKCSGGLSEENIDKNRFKDTVPTDGSRPYLMTEGTDNSTNYINATFMHGYRTKDAFLTTQMPLPNTVGDIWRLVYDYKCSTIVMLNDMDPTDKTLCQYWPSKGLTAQFGPFNVECVSEEQTDKDIIKRTFNLKNRNSQDQQTIIQFSLQNWSNDSNHLPDPKSVVALAMNVSDEMNKMPENRVAIHCIDGMGVSGTFCAIVSAIDRIAAEQTVDVFQTVKRLRTCNPRAVNTKKQYKFIYDVVQESLESNQVYENFVQS